MPPLTDPDRLAAFKEALGNSRFSGYVQFELSEEAHLWIRNHLGISSIRELAHLMHEFVDGGGEVDEVKETRSRWSSEHEFHHDLRFMIADIPVYVETRLRYRLPLVADDSSILVVNVHAP